jgi:hypothetical protein
MNVTADRRRSRIMLVIWIRRTGRMSVHWMQTLVRQPDLRELVRLHKEAASCIHSRIIAIAIATDRGHSKPCLFERKDA